MGEPGVVTARAGAPRAPGARMLADVRAGLLAPRKALPPTYFYDSAGSRLFDRITRLPEYYLTRAERALLDTHARGLVRDVAPRALAELGAGTADKTRVLLRAMIEAGPAQYLPIDVDATTLRLTTDALRDELPSLEVTPIVADMRDDVRAAGARRPLLYTFLGSTIGNFAPVAARELLARIRDTLRPGDRLLLGVDLVKDPATLEAAYDDSLGVTAAFNRNVLRVLNRELGADFDVDAFTHRALYDRALCRIEMHLVARTAQRVRIPGVGVVTFSAGESMLTEISCKYDRRSAESLLEESGFAPTAWLADDESRFALALAAPRA